MNWRRGFFRSWIFVSVLWVSGIGAAFWKDTARNLEFARLSDEKLIALVYPACAEIPNPPPTGFILDDCAAALQKAGRNHPFDVYDLSKLRSWGRRNTYTEQFMRMMTAALPMIVLLLGPPICFLLFGAAVVWVSSGFKVPKRQIDLMSGMGVKNADTYPPQSRLTVLLSYKRGAGFAVRRCRGEAYTCAVRRPRRDHKQRTV